MKLNQSAQTIFLRGSAKDIGWEEVPATRPEVQIPVFVGCLRKLYDP